MPAYVAVTANIGTQAFEGSLVAPDLHLILANLYFGCMVPAIKNKAVAVLLQLPFIALQFALVSAEINSAPHLGRSQGSRA